MFYKPIFHWLLDDIWGYIRKYDLPYLKLYDLGGCRRVGCIVCPFQTWRERLRQQTMYPRFYALLLRYCEKLFLLRENYFGNGRFKSGQDLYDWWCSGESEASWRNDEKDKLQTK